MATREARYAATLRRLCPTQAQTAHASWQRGLLPSVRGKGASAGGFKAGPDLLIIRGQGSAVQRGGRDPATVNDFAVRGTFPKQDK